MERKRNLETEEEMEGEGGESETGRELEGVEGKRNQETEEGMEGEGG